MRALFDLGHPAHFHLFRHVMGDMAERGDTVEILAREKDCLLDLLAANNAGWTVHLVRSRRRNRLSLLKETLSALGKAGRRRLGGRFDILAGTSIVVGPASRAMGGKSFVFGEDDAKVVPLFTKIAYPPAHYVVTPACLGFEDYGCKHLTYPGYQELAYLHPSRFQADPAIRRELGVADDERLFLVRLVALRAHHDVGQAGLSPAQAREVVGRLQQHGRVLISAEAEVEADLREFLLPTPPERIHHVLAAADLVIGDSQTMAAEAAVLGTPALRCNTFVGRLSYLEELEHSYGLTVGVRPENFERLRALLEDWLARAELKAEWQRRREAMLADCVDLSAWMLETFDRVAAGGSPVVASQAGSAS
ncbi:MAG: hypothetical protein ACOC93_06955 [Planctomycetota bacterium]